MRGDDLAPCASKILAPISESSAVETPGRTAAAIALSALATIWPQALNFSNCSEEVIDIDRCLDPIPGCPPPSMPMCPQSIDAPSWEPTSQPVECDEARAASLKGG